jgi:hypothetical protein
MIRRAGEGEYDPPTADAFEHMPYSRAQVMPDSIYPPGLQQDWRSGVLTGLIDAAIETITRLFATVPSRRSTVVLEHNGDGAMDRVDESHGVRQPPVAVQPARDLDLGRSPRRRR